MLSENSPGKPRSRSWSETFFGSNLRFEYRRLYLDLLQFGFFSLLFVASGLIRNYLPLEIQYPLVVAIIFFLPLFAGNLGFWWLLQTTKISKDENWLKLPLYWVLGLVFLNLPYYLNSFLKLTPLWMVWLAIFIFFIPYLWFNRRSLMQIKHFQFTAPANRRSFQILMLCLVLIMLRQIFWGGIKGNTSISLDSYQNFHLALIMNQGGYSIWPSNLATIFKLDSYTSFLIPILAVSANFFNWLGVLKFMHIFEIAADAVIFWIRKKFFEKAFFINENTAAILSLFSVYISYFIINNTPLLQNQNIVVLLFTTSLYYLIKGRYLPLLITLIVGAPFHFFITGITLVYFLIYTFTNTPVIAKFYFKYRPTLNLFMLVSFASLTYLSLNTTLQSWFITFAKTTSNTPSIITFAEGFKLSTQLHHVTDAFGPATIAALVVCTVLGIFTVYSKNIWLFIIGFMHIVFFLIPFEFFGRVMGLAAIPFMLILYFAIKSMAKKSYLVNAYLIGLLFINCFWWINIVAQTPNTLYTSTFFSSGFDAYLPNLLQSPQFKDSIGNNPQQVKVVSDYVTKHFSEIVMRKTNDYGIYEDRSDERRKNLMVLRGKSDPCQEFSEPFVLILVNEKTIRFLDFPDRIITDSLLNIYDGREPDYLIQQRIKDFNLSTQSRGKILLKRTNDYDMKAILIQCK